MTYNPKIHHRQSIRLKGYDYSYPGVYFVTLCTKDRKSYFSDEVARKVAKDCWCELSRRFKNVELDEYVIVPNHIHGVIIIRLCENNKAKSGLDKSGLDKSGFDKSNPYRILIPNNPMLMPRDTLGKIIRYYKAKSAYLIRNVYGYRCFSWQSRYYDRIIWDKFGLERVRNYIRNHKKLLDRS